MTCASRIALAAAQRIGVNRRGIAPPDPAEPKKVEARMVQPSIEPSYSTSAFNALLGGALADVEIGFIGDLGAASKALKRFCDCITKPLELLGREEAMIRMGTEHAQVL